MKVYGLIGFPLSHSFSKKYFTEKFKSESLTDHSYLNFEIKSIEELHDLIHSQNNLIGLNVTIPHKVSVLKFIDELDSEAEEIGAVNTINIARNSKNKKFFLSGFNTDAIGFEKSLKPLLKPHHKKAFILGTGGASKAVAYVLKKLQIEYKFVSRQKKKFHTILYQEINEYILKDNSIIINTTPFGKSPDNNSLPALPYSAIDSNHLLYDLNYNPEITAFLQKGMDHGASIKNGMEMLQLQAEAAWAIWNNK